MHKRKATLFVLGLLCMLATACSFPGLAAPTPFVLPTPTVLVLLHPTASTPAVPTLLAGSPVPGLTQVFVTQGAVTPIVATPAPPVDFCGDAQVKTLINNLKAALQASNGTLLASLVSPTHGMEARLYRNGTVVNYDRLHTKFLFETTYVVDWGAAPGSGIETMGPFHETIIPDLRDVFTKSYTLACNEVKVGGTTYKATWPYSGINFYSVYYPGTDAKGNMDWHTWLLGVHYVNRTPYLYAIMQFKWEP